MKRITSLCALLLLATATWSLAQTGAGEKAVTDLEKQWLKGQQTNNVALIEPLLAEGFVNTDSEGKFTDRAETIAQAKATKYTSVDYGDLKVKIFGSTGVATGTFRGTGTDSSGKPLDAKERFTDTWTKMASGKWQCVASQQSAIK
jgi:ketosteroid isomerase-like protein